LKITTKIVNDYQLREHYLILGTHTPDFYFQYNGKITTRYLYRDYFLTTKDLRSFTKQVVEIEKLRMPLTKQFRKPK